MKIMQLEDAPLVRGLEHRGGTFHSRTMAEGVPGTPVGVTSARGVEKAG